MNEERIANGNTYIKMADLLADFLEKSTLEYLFMDSRKYARKILTS